MEHKFYAPKSVVDSSREQGRSQDLWEAALTLFAERGYRGRAGARHTGTRSSPEGSVISSKREPRSHRFTRTTSSLSAARLPRCSSSSSMFRQRLLPVSHSSDCSTANAVTSLRHAPRLGKILTTFVVRRFISRSNLSNPLVVRMRAVGGSRGRTAKRGTPLCALLYVLRDLRVALSPPVG